MYESEAIGKRRGLDSECRSSRIGEQIHACLARLNELYTSVQTGNALLNGVAGGKGFVSWAEGGADETPIETWRADNEVDDAWAGMYGAWGGVYGAWAGVYGAWGGVDGAWAGGAELASEPPLSGSDFGSGRG